MIVLFMRLIATSAVLLVSVAQAAAPGACPPPPQGMEPLFKTGNAAVENVDPGTIFHTMTVVFVADAKTDEAARELARWIKTQAPVDGSPLGVLQGATETEDSVFVTSNRDTAQMTSYAVLQPHLRKDEYSSIYVHSGLQNHESAGMLSSRKPVLAAGEPVEVMFDSHRVDPAIFNVRFNKGDQKGSLPSMSDMMDRGAEIICKWLSMRGEKNAVIVGAPEWLGRLLTKYGADFKGKSPYRMNVFKVDPLAASWAIIRNVEKLGPGAILSFPIKLYRNDCTIDLNVIKELRQL